MRALRWTTGGALALTYGLIVLGGWVRATGSGLACPDWPTCYGHWVPLPGEIPPDAGYSYFQVMLEWGHRLIAGVFLGPLILVIGILCWRVRAGHRRMPLYGALLLLLLLLQASLGGVTVLDQNSPWSVALHLTTALLLFSVLWLILERARSRATGVEGVARPLAVLVWVLALAGMASAAMTTKSGAALACSTWPLCDGALLPDLGDDLVRLNFSHRLLAAGVGLGTLALWFATRRRPMATVALALILAEILLGGLVVLWEVPSGAAVAHQALGVLAFGAMTWLMWRIHAPLGNPEPLHVRRLSRA